MLFATHVIAAISVASAFGADCKNSFIAGVFSVLPDIDTPKSFVGRRLRIISQLLTHRGFTHSLVALFIIYISIFYLFNPQTALYASLGWASHIILDVFNPTGVQLFWPFKRFISLGYIKTGGVFEFFIIALVLIITRVNI